MTTNWIISENLEWSTDDQQLNEDALLMDGVTLTIRNVQVHFENESMILMRGNNVTVHVQNATVTSSDDKGLGLRGYDQNTGTVLVNNLYCHNMDT